MTNFKSSTLGRRLPRPGGRDSTFEGETPRFKAMIDDLYSLKILKLAAHLPRTGRLRRARRIGRGAGRETVRQQGPGGPGSLKATGWSISPRRSRPARSGQAAAAILGEHVIGAEVSEIETARDQLSAMLKSSGPAPVGRFADLAALDQVRDYPARHASTLVAFEAAVAAAHAALNARTPRTSTADAA